MGFRFRSTSAAPLALGLFFQMGCSGSSSAPADQLGPEGGMVVMPAGDDASTPVTSAACMSDKQCAPSGQLCDTARHLCVECIDNSSCMSPATCEQSHCVTIEVCTNSLDCKGGHVCDKSSNRCVECVMDTDCAAMQACSGNVCRSKCTSDKDCQAQKLLCDTAAGHCAECLKDPDCTGGACISSKCVPYACQPNSITCVGGQATTCSARGDAFGPGVSCPAECQPGIGCGEGVDSGEPVDGQPDPIDSGLNPGMDAIAPTGLAMHWTLDELTGSTANDSSCNGHTGTLQGLANWGGGKVNGAATFNGTSSFISTPGPVVDTSQPYTVAAWALMTTVPLGAYKTVASIEGVSASVFVLQLRGDTGTFSFASQSYDGVSAAIIASATSAPVAQVWYHLAGVFDGASLRLYLNGVLQSSTTRAVAWRATGDTIVGRARYSGAPTDYWPGLIDDVRVYSRALSADEVARIATP